MSRDGLTPISEAGMKDWFADNLNTASKIIGSYDSRKSLYNVTLKDYTSDTPTLIPRDGLIPRQPNTLTPRATTLPPSQPPTPRPRTLPTSDFPQDITNTSEPSDSGGY